MSTLKLKTEGGQGGRRGHSNMAHWFTTEEIKTAARGRRRREGKAEIGRALKDLPGREITRPRDAP